MQAIERTPPLASASRIAPIASAEATAEVETSVEAAAAAEAANLESTLSRIDKLLSDMAAEETATAAEKVMVVVPDKGKRLLMLLQKKVTLTFGTWWVKSCLRVRRRSYRSMGYPVATSQELCSLVELMKKP
jgi:acyl-CoA reductase-like NAD-dependent aldehyde dehydrogenase